MIILTSDDEWFIATSNELFFATINKGISQRMTSIFLQEATSATSNEWILQRVTSDFLQRATSATSNEQISQQTTSVFFATSNFCNE